jgi:xylan 1,4-beta-xylosidase
VELSLRGIPDGKARLEHFRIDDEHSNAFTAWKRMGSPDKPAPDQYVSLEKAGKLAALPAAELEFNDGAATIRFQLPRQAVSLLVIRR